MSRTAQHRRLPFAALWVLLLGSLVSVMAMQWHATRNARAQAESLNTAAERVGNEVQRRMVLYQYGLRGARGAIITAGDQDVDHADFRRYANTRDVDAEFSGARGFGFIRRVAPDQLDAFLARSRLLRPDFAVRELADHEGDHYVIEFIEPVARNAQAVGLDIGSETNRRMAAERAMREGQPVVTAPITLVQASGDVAQGLLVLMPVYRDGARPGDVAERERLAVGWSYAPLVMSEVLAGLGELAPATRIVVVDEGHAAASGNRTPLFATGTEDAVEAASHASVRRLIYGREWSIRVEAQSGFAAPLNLGDPLHTLAGGVLLSLLLGSLAETVRQIRFRRHDLALVRRRMADIVEHASDAMFGEAKDGRIVSWNPAAQKLFGVAADEAVGRRLTEFAQLQDNPGDAGASDAPERRLVLRDGRHLEVLFARTAIRDAPGSIAGFSCVVHDVSQRREAERRLRNFNIRLESLVSERTRELEVMRRELQLVLDAVPTLIASWDRALCCRVANRSALDWFGFTGGDPVGAPMERLWGDTLSDTLRAHFNVALAGSHQEFDLALPTTDSQGIRRTQWRLLPERDSDGVMGVLAVAIDVTELSRHRDALERERTLLAETARTLRGVLRAASEVSIIATDVEGQIILFNSGAERMLGHAAETMVGQQSLCALIDTEELARLARTLPDTPPLSPFRALVARAEKEGAETREWHYLALSGDRIAVSQTITAIRDDAGVLTGFLSVARDITESLRSEQAKNAFIATVNHELRTPLTVINGALKLVNSGALGALSTQAATVLRAAEGNGERLGLLINDLLDAEKLAAGMMVYRNEPVAVTDVVEAAVESTRSYLSDRGVLLHLFADDPTLRVQVDPLRLTQILVNLVSNAIKFTPPGQRVDVSVSRGDGVARICIRDRGPGIPREFRSHVFERFAQADNSDRRRPGGTGLGLAISHDLVIGMNGQIGFEDAEGGGTTFWVSFPLLQDSALAMHGAT